MKFYLVKEQFGPIDLRSWALKIGNHWVNPAGGRRPVDSEDKVLEEVEAESFLDLDYFKTSLCDIQSKGDRGWLSPEGRFYRCGWMEHDFVAAYLFKKDQDQLFKEGWIRLEGGKDFFYRRLTAEQRNFLSFNGFNLDDGDDYRVYEAVLKQ